jgi:hypothetical protein
LARSARTCFAKPCWAAATSAVFLSAGPCDCQRQPRATTATTATTALCARPRCRSVFACGLARLIVDPKKVHVNNYPPEVVVFSKKKKKNVPFTIDVPSASHKRHPLLAQARGRSCSRKIALPLAGSLHQVHSPSSRREDQRCSWRSHHRCRSKHRSFVAPTWSSAPPTLPNDGCCTGGSSTCSTSYLSLSVLKNAGKSQSSQHSGLDTDNAEMVLERLRVGRVRNDQLGHGLGAHPSLDRHREVRDQLAGQAPCSQNGYLSSRGGCPNRWHSRVNCDHGDSTTSHFDAPRRCRTGPTAVVTT